MKKIMQFRFEGFQNKNNYPDFSDYNAVLTQGNIFKDYSSVSKMGIQGPVGLKFHLNRGDFPITIGKTGIYEIDLEGIGRINSIQFDPADISTFFPNDNQTNRLLIDIIYDGGVNEQ